MSNGKGSRDRSDPVKFRKGFEYMMRQTERKMKHELEDITRMLDGPGFAEALARTENERKKYLEHKQQ